jgi:N-acetylneuraminic acid mutarotase
MPAGTERGAAVVGVVAGKVYLAGGLRGGAVADVSSFDAANNTWDTTLPPLPQPRDHACGGAIGGKVYVAGGRRGTVGTIAGEVFEYTPGGAWIDRSVMPTPRGGTACGVIDGRLVVVGGEGNPAVPSGVFPQAEAFTAATNSWESLAPMAVPRHGMGAAASGERLYVPGGATRETFGAVDVHEVFTP